MPISSKESWKPSRFRPEIITQNTPDSEENSTKWKVPTDFSIRIPMGKLVFQIEPRFFLILAFILPLYLLAAFVGNDWGYMLPCALLACLIIGIVLPLLQVCSIGCSYRTAPTSSTDQTPELLLRVWRLPFFGLLSYMIPTGYLNANLHLSKRTWEEKNHRAEIVPLPVVISKLSKTIELKMPMPGLGRGVFRAERLEFSSCFPFAICWWSKRVRLEADGADNSITVLPQLTKIIGNFHSRLTQTASASGRIIKNSFLPSRSSTLKGLREFSERDSLNQIHWASSAKTGKLMVREFEIESLPDFDILLKLDAEWGKEQFELACISAYALVHYGRSCGFDPTLHLYPACDWEPIMRHIADIPAGLDGEQLAAEMLARVSPVSKRLSEEYQQFLNSNQASRLSLVNASTSTRSIIRIEPLAKSRGSNAVQLTEERSIEANVLAGSTTVAKIETAEDLVRI